MLRTITLKSKQMKSMTSPQDDELKNYLKHKLAFRTPEMLSARDLNPTSQTSVTGVKQRGMQDIAKGNTLPGSITLYKLRHTLKLNLNWYIHGDGGMFLPFNATHSSAEKTAQTDAHETESLYESAKLASENEQLRADLAAYKDKLMHAYEELLRLKNDHFVE